MRGRKYGFPLEDIRQWLLIYEDQGNQAQMAAFVAMADQQMLELNKQKQQLDEAIDALKQMRDQTAKSLT